jgi:hypothetical protein
VCVGVCVFFFGGRNCARTEEEGGFIGKKDN